MCCVKWEIKRIEKKKWYNFKHIHHRITSFNRIQIKIVEKQQQLRLDIYLSTEGTWFILFKSIWCYTYHSCIQYTIHTYIFSSYLYFVRIVGSFSDLYHATKKWFCYFFFAKEMLFVQRIISEHSECSVRRISFQRALHIRASKSHRFFYEFMRALFQINTLKFRHCIHSTTTTMNKNGNWGFRGEILVLLLEYQFGSTPIRCKNERNWN